MMRIHPFSAALFAAAALAGAAAAQQPSRPPGIPEADRVRLAEAYRLAAAIGDSIWPGWSGVPFATVLVSGEHEYFVRHPNPPSGTTPLGRDAMLGSDVFARPRTLSPGFLATFPLEGVSTVVVGTVETTGASSPTDWVVTLLHEHFHQLQESRPGFYGKTAALGLARGDQTGMWMLNFPFAYDSPKVRDAYAESASALRAALVGDGDGDAAAVAAYVKARAALRAALSDDDRKYMDFQLWKEGVARYTQLRVARWAAERYRPSAEFAGLPGYAGFDAISRSLSDQIPKELAELKLSESKRVVFYPYGAAEALLLDRVRPSWRERYFTDLFTLDPGLGTREQLKVDCSPGEEPPGHVRAEQPLLRVRAHEREGAAHQELRLRRRRRLRLAAGAAPRRLRGHPEWRHLRRAARLSQQLDRGASPHDEGRARRASVHRHRRLPRHAEAAHADRLGIHLTARVVESSEDRAVVDGDPRGERQGDRDVPRHVRRGQAGASGVPQVVRRIRSIGALLALLRRGPRTRRVDRAEDRRLSRQEAHLRALRPASVSKDKLAPILVAMHGSTSNGQDHRSTAGPASRTPHGVIVAGPDATDNKMWVSPQDGPLS
jgi:hypothetical protein